MEATSLVIDTQKVVQRIRETGEWVVILCPDHVITRACCTALSCALPAGTAFSGRTARLAKGRVSVVCASEDVFVPLDEPFVTIYIGWKAKDNPGGMDKWQSRALKVISL